MTKFITPEVREELKDLMSPANVYGMYLQNNWTTILLGNERPVITVDQFDDMYTGYFDLFGIMGNPVRDSEDFSNRIQTFAMQMQYLARSIYPLDMFVEHILKDNDIIAFGLEQVNSYCTITEQSFVDFRSALAEKQSVYRAKYGHPANLKTNQND